MSVKPAGTTIQARTSLSADDTAVYHRYQSSDDTTKMRDITYMLDGEDGVTEDRSRRSHLDSLVTEDTIIPTLTSHQNQSIKQQESSHLSKSNAPADRRRSDYRTPVKADVGPCKSEAHLGRYYESVQTEKEQIAIIRTRTE